MSPKISIQLLRRRAEVFSALGDVTRLTLIQKLVDGEGHSIARLSEGTRLTRQAITKHLRVLEAAGLVQNSKAGRETLFELDPGPLSDASNALESVAGEWDRALGRLKLFAENSK